MFLPKNWNFSRVIEKKNALQCVHSRGSYTKKKSIFRHFVFCQFTFEPIRSHRSINQSIGHSPNEHFHFASRRWRRLKRDVIIFDDVFLKKKLTQAFKENPAHLVGIQLSYFERGKYRSMANLLLCLFGLSCFVMLLILSTDWLAWLYPN